MLFYVLMFMLVGAVGAVHGVQVLEAFQPAVGPVRAGEAEAALQHDQRQRTVREGGCRESGAVQNGLDLPFA